MLLSHRVPGRREGRWGKCFPPLKCLTLTHIRAYEQAHVRHAPASKHVEGDKWNVGPWSMKIRFHRRETRGGVPSAAQDLSFSQRRLTSVSHNLRTPVTCGTLRRFASAGVCRRSRGSCRVPIQGYGSTKSSSRNSLVREDILATVCRTGVGRPLAPFGERTGGVAQSSKTCCTIAKRPGVQYSVLEWILFRSVTVFLDRKFPNRPKWRRQMGIT